MSALHVSLNVSDLERSANFYRGLFGEPSKEKPDYVKFVGADPEIHLALQPAGSKMICCGPLSHLGIRVGSSEEVERRRSALEARGFATEEEKGTTCCYARQDKFWIADPDGNRWEVYTVLEDVEPEGKPAASRACC